MSTVSSFAPAPEISGDRGVRFAGNDPLILYAGPVRCATALQPVHRLIVFTESDVDVREADIIREHAKLGGFPADRVLEVTTIIDPTTAETNELAAAT